MWRLLFVLVVGCSDSHSHQTALDASLDAFIPGLDGDTNFCDAATSSGHAALTKSGVTTDYSYTFVGGVSSGGDLLPGNPPMGVTLLFTNSARVSSQMLMNCESGANSACTIDGAIANTFVEMDTAVGPHDAQYQSFSDAAFKVSGTANISDFAPPIYNQSAGRVAGTLSTTVNGDSLTATFNAQFCAELLYVTI